MAKFAGPIIARLIMVKFAKLKVNSVQVTKEDATFAIVIAFAFVIATIIIALIIVVIVIASYFANFRDYHRITTVRAFLQIPFSCPFYFEPQQRSPLDQ